MTLGQSLILLLVTAALTGLLVPTVKDLVDQRRLAKQSVFEDGRLRAQKQFEAELARQTRIIDAQAELLDELASLSWAFEKLVLRVTFYGAGGDYKKFAAALQAFDTDSWGLLANLLAATSKARRLAPSEAHQRLQGLYRQLVEKVAPYVEPMRSFRPDAENAMSAEQMTECHKLNRYIYDHLAPEIDDVLASLADDFRLSAGSENSPTGEVAKNPPARRAETAPPDAPDAI